MKSNLALLLFIGIATIYGSVACSTADSQSTTLPTLAPPAALPADSASTGEAAVGDDIASRCTDVHPHPLGESIAATFHTTYDEVMRWFCNGYPFEDILIALQTEEMSDHSAEALLAMRQARSWEQIWADLGIVAQ